MDERPIGIFDSGLGGLTVIKEIKKTLPDENIVYLGDTARVPYGTRGKQTVIKFSLQDAKFLLKHEVKCIVIACNTASALAFRAVEREITIPVFDVVSAGAKEAVRLTKNKKIGVIGTRGTVASHAYKNFVSKLAPETEMYEKACPLFVPLIEEDEIEGELILILADKYLGSVKKAGVDTLVLGCTHYPIIEKVIRKEMGKEVILVNSGKEVAKELLVYLKKKQMLAPENNKPGDEYFVTDLTQRFIKVAEMFLGESLKRKIKEVSVN